MRILALRMLVFLIAAGLPLGVLLVAGNGPPPSLDVVALDTWSPVRNAGPSARLFATGLTSLAGLSSQTVPAWFTPEDRTALGKAESALGNNKLKEALGHMMVLSSQLEDRGKTLNDILPMVVPSLAAWMIANYFAPVVLGSLLVLMVILAFGPWLIRRFYDFLKLVMALLLGSVAIAVAVALCFALAGQKALVFALIEYLTASAILLTAGNLGVYAVKKRSLRHASAAIPALGAQRRDRLRQRPAEPALTAAPADAVATGATPPVTGVKKPAALASPAAPPASETPKP